MEVKKEVKLEVMRYAQDDRITIKNLLSSTKCVTPCLQSRHNSLFNFLFNFLFFVLLLLFAACSEDSPSEQEVQTPNASLRMVNAKRAPLGGDDDGDIKVFLTNGTDVAEGMFKYNETVWNTQLKLKSGTKTYHVYGFTPAIDGLTANLTSFTANSGVLSIQGLDVMTNRDYCVITGVRRVENESDMTSAVRGQMSFEYASSRMNYINLLFDHLFGRISFKMKIGTDYSALRTIKVKRMQLQVAGYKKVDVVATLTDGRGIDQLTYNPVATSDNTTMTIWDSETSPITLTTSPVEVASAQIATITGLINNLQLYTEYDVYDKEGKFIAERTATNQLKTILKDITRGQERVLNITVDPSYLYILSDADLDNPPFIIE